MTEEHALAPYLRTIGRGPTLSRPLERHEAREAMRLILSGAADPAQVGALLLLLRYRGETAEELAGMVEAARDCFVDPVEASGVDLDWPSYADRHRQQPWFIPAALLLAENGVKVLMHGIAGYAEGYAPTRPALEILGLRPHASLAEAAAGLERDNFAYVGLERFCPPLDRLFGLRPLLGVRTAVNTAARALNPLRARHQLQGVFHPPYRDAHRDVALLEKQPFAARRTGPRSCRIRHTVGATSRSSPRAWPPCGAARSACRRPRPRSRGPWRWRSTSSDGPRIRPARNRRRRPCGGTDRRRSTAPGQHPAPSPGKRITL
jgi:hypothetical protein